MPAREFGLQAAVLAFASHGKSNMQTTLIVIHLLIVLSLIGVVLLQRSEGGALGIGGGGGGGFMSNRGTGNLLTRATALLAAGFFVTSLSLSVLAGWRPAAPSVIQRDAPVTTPDGPSILEQLQKQKGPVAPPQSK
jgi:preprotein translocase subunit SecG